MKGTGVVIVVVVIIVVVIVALVAGRDGGEKVVPGEAQQSVAAIQSEVDYADVQAQLANFSQLSRQEQANLLSGLGRKKIRWEGTVLGGRQDVGQLQVLVDMEPGRSLLDMGGLLMDLQELLGCRVDVVTERGLRRRIRDRVLQEAVPI